MFFFLNLDGTVTRDDSEHVYQGQNNVAKVELITPITPLQTAIQVAFTLPSGLVQGYFPMGNPTPYSLDKDNKMQVYKWSYPLNYNITETEGVVGVSFNIVKIAGTDSSGNAIIVGQTTYTSSFTVEYSALPAPPTTATESELEYLLNLLQLYYNQNTMKSFNLGTVETNTLAPGTNASVKVNEAVDEKTGVKYTNFVFGIPKGDRGETGPQGISIVSASVIKED